MVIFIHVYLMHKTHWIMVTSMLASIKSVIKGYHVYKYTCPVRTILQCYLEPENEHSDSAVIVKNSGSVVGHIAEGLSSL